MAHVRNAVTVAKAVSEIQIPIEIKQVDPMRAEVRIDGVRYELVLYER